MRYPYHQPTHVAGRAYPGGHGGSSRLGLWPGRVYGKVREVATAKGWDGATIHSEAFQPAAPDTGAESGEIFTIKLASTGERWPVPADKTIALQENGVAVPLSCEMGICGACLTPVIDGVVDHRDSVQSEAEKTPRTRMWRCVAQEVIPLSW